MTVDMDEENGLHYPSRAVVDTCVLLNIALGSHDSGGPKRLSRSEGLIDDAIGGKLELLMPSLVLVELSTDHILRAGKSVPLKQFREEKKLAMDWCMNCSLPMAELTKGAAEWFNETSCVQGIRTADACVLATAWYADASVIYTWDEDFRKKVNAADESDGIGIVAEEPPERVPHLFEAGIDS